jgi:biopolymer transport protein ExbB
MSALRFRAVRYLVLAVTLTVAQPAFAQQNSPPLPQQAQASQPSQPVQAQGVPAGPAVAPTSAAATEAVPGEGGSRSLKSTGVAMRELSPWSMFLSADILVKAVMVGLAFASLVTWTIFIAKMIELSLVRRRLSAGISSDAGIKERAASSFAEIVRAEARRIRLGMGLLATIGATSPFVGLFGTVWGIMNSFIGISKSQTTNLAVVAPGIAEALLATAFGLVAAIPAVIIYNHFARITKGYLELVARSSGAAGRLLSRDLDRTHVSSNSRAAE